MFHIYIHRANLLYFGCVFYLCQLINYNVYIYVLLLIIKVKVHCVY